jgi:hypothetical protein
MNEKVPKYIQKAIDDLRKRTENLKILTYLIFILLIGYLAYEKFTDTRYYDFGCVNVIYSSDFLTYEINNSRRYTYFDPSDYPELNRTIVQNFSLGEVFNLNQELRKIEEGSCEQFLDYFANK